MHQNEIPPGTLYLLILKALARGRELHGYELAHWIEQRQRGSTRGQIGMKVGPYRKRANE
jgi:hypothetical protein